MRAYPQPLPKGRGEAKGEEAIRREIAAKPHNTCLYTLRSTSYALRSTLYTLHYKLKKYNDHHSAVCRQDNRPTY